MKKNNVLVLAAMAALACSGNAALAQSNVSLYGLLDMSVGTSKAPGATGSGKGADSGKMSTSFIGFKGSEDLGGGLTAIFQLDSFLRADGGQNGRFNGDAFWARNAWVGLSSKEYGTIKLGRNTTPLFVSTLSFNPFGDSFGYSPSIRHIFSSNTTSGDSGWNDSVLYSTPNLDGFTATAFIAAGEGSNGRNLGFSGQYGSSGPFAAAVVYQDVKKDGATAVDDTKTWQGNASYDFGVVKLFAQYAKVDNDTRRVDYKLYELGAAVPVGNGKFLAQFGKISASAGAGRKTFTIGYDHWLSKRTDVYAMAMSDKVDNLSKGNSISVGVRHRF